MMAMAIIAISLSLAASYIADNHERYALNQESARLQTVFRLAATDAMLQDSQWGMYVTPQSYGFGTFDIVQRRWIRKNGPLYAAYALPRGLHLTLTMDGNPVQLPGDATGGEYPDILLLSSGQTSAFTLTMQSNADGGEKKLHSDGHSDLVSETNHAPGP